MKIPFEEPPCKKKKTSQSSLSLLSLPDEIIVNCLAHISKSYYPKLSLVCKTFSSLILSVELYVARLNLGTHENVLHVCLQLPGSRLPKWFSLWIKPDQTLTNNIRKKKNNSSGNTLLVPVPSSYSPRVPMFIGAIGSELYGISRYNIPSSRMWVRYTSINSWREAPSMTVPRANPVACILDRKIYVMGGCTEDESAIWAEVFDSKTQTWEPLPDPGVELRLSSLKTLEVIEGNIYIKSTEKMYYVYDPKEGKWKTEVEEIKTMCEIENVRYSCDGKGFFWYDTKHEKWTVVKGLVGLDRSPYRDFVAIANYNGKLLVLWEKFLFRSRSQEKNIRCAVIGLKRGKNDEVRGKIEWASDVLTVPSSYVFLRCEVKPV